MLLSWDSFCSQNSPQPLKQRVLVCVERKWHASTPHTGRLARTPAAVISFQDQGQRLGPNFTHSASCHHFTQRGGSSSGPGRVLVQWDWKCSLGLLQLAESNCKPEPGNCFYFIVCEHKEKDEAEEKAVRSDRGRAQGVHFWSGSGVVRMEIRPDRFKAVAAKTLGKIYGYVCTSHVMESNERWIWIRSRCSATSGSIRCKG